MTTIDEKTKITFRKPGLSDASAIWRLIRHCPPLDVNSSYAYLILCEHFADTCVVAIMDDRLAGYVSGFLPPSKPDTLFIWQVAVDERSRGLGLAGRMMRDILRRESCRNVTRLQTTVTPSNSASRRMFQSLARRLDADYDEVPHFGAELIGEDGHEGENLVTIGPFGAERQHKKES